MTAWDQFLSGVVFLFLAPVGVLLANILYVRLLSGKAKNTKPSSTASPAVTAKRINQPNTGRATKTIRLPQAG